MAKTQAPKEQVWWSGLRWVDAAHMQIWRFEEAFGEWIAALADAKIRRDHYQSPEANQQWREHLDGLARYDSQRPLRVPMFGLQMQVANELDLLSVAIRNVQRAQERIPKQQCPDMSGLDLLKLLRNVAEHWDEVGGHSATTLARDHPGTEVGQIAHTNKEIWIGGENGVPISRMRAWLERVRRALADCLEDEGIEVPEHEASLIDGDDNLTWPAERLRFHWSLARAEEQKWPRDPMPEDIVEVLAERFARLRARDSED